MLINKDRMSYYYFKLGHMFLTTLDYEVLACTCSDPTFLYAKDTDCF